jgi:restriction system protein
MDARFIDQTDLVSGLSSAPNLMDLTPGEFEILVANLFGQMGLESKLTRSSKDGGVDCIAYDKRPILGGKVVIQAKRYRHTVGVSAVRDLYGTMMNEGANKGILVTTSGYGPDAFNFASDKPIELIDGGGLLWTCLGKVERHFQIMRPVSRTVRGLGSQAPSAAGLDCKSHRCIVQWRLLLVFGFGRRFSRSVLISVS